jgi:hypothetical protein
MDSTPASSNSEGMNAESRGASAAPRGGAERGAPPVHAAGGPRVEPPPARPGEPGMSPEPTQAEVEAWAESVRLRRQAWLDGPTEEEKVEWYRRERARRLARLGFEPESRAGVDGPRGRDPDEERRRIERRYIREARLAAEGLAVFMATWPFRTWATLVATGQEWEEEYLHAARRRWIPFNDDV